MWKGRAPSFPLLHLFLILPGFVFGTPSPEGHVECSQAREQDPELCSWALGVHCCRVNWGQCWRQRPGLQPCRLAWPQPQPSFFSLLSALSGLAPKYSPFSGEPHVPTTPLLCRNTMNIGFLGASPPWEHTDNPTENFKEAHKSREYTRKKGP